MAVTLFNIHDLVLLLTSFECAVFAILILSNKLHNRTHYYLFAILLLSHTFIALHELVLWGATFREWVLNLSPNLFFIFNFSYLLDGPLVYLFIASLYARSFKLQLKHLLHFFPVILFVLYLYFAFWGLPHAEKVEMIKTHDIAYSWHYVSTDLAVKSVRVFYVILALIEVRKHLRTAESHALDRTPWIFYLVAMFLVVSSWELLLTAIKFYGLKFSIDLDLLEIIGLVDYYALFALINLVLYVAITEISNRTLNKKHKPVEKIDLEQVDKIEYAMGEKKLFLDPLLSFERFAERVDMPAKELSYIINHYYKVNFYEFVNSYRIADARNKLISPDYADKNITEIFYSAGFNSKSVYNTLFKKVYKSTPSAYRKLNS